MLRDAPILILDEAIASLDPVTEDRVRRAIDRFAAGRTTLAFGHQADNGAPERQIVRLPTLTAPPAP